MRRFIALLVVVALVQLASGCRHVAGSCDCEHADGKTGSRGGNCCGVVQDAPAGASHTASYMPMPK